MSNVEQIIKTAKKQHERGELTPLEYKAVHDRWKIDFVIDADSIKKSLLKKNAL